MPLTRKQREMLDFLTGAIDRQGYAPSFEEIAERWGPTFRRYGYTI